METGLRQACPADDRKGCHGRNTCDTLFHTHGHDAGKGAAQAAPFPHVPDKAGWCLVHPGHGFPFMEDMIQRSQYGSPRNEDTAVAQETSGCLHIGIIIREMKVCRVLWIIHKVHRLSYDNVLLMTVAVFILQAVCMLVGFKLHNGNIICDRVPSSCCLDLFHGIDNRTRGRGLFIELFLFLVLPGMQCDADQDPADQRASQEQDNG